MSAGSILYEPMRFVWFQSIDGFTGFFLRQIAYRPWQNGMEGTIKSHLKHDWRGEEVYLLKGMAGQIITSPLCNFFFTFTNPCATSRKE